MLRIMLPNASIMAVRALTFMATVPEYCISYLNVHFVVHMGKLSPKDKLDAKLRGKSSIHLQMFFCSSAFVWNGNNGGIVQTAFAAETLRYVLIEKQTIIIWRIDYDNPIL